MGDLGRAFLAVCCISIPGLGAAANWVEHKDPAGFVVKHPPGWLVDTPEKNLVVVRDAAGASQAIAYGFMTRPEVTCPQWMQRQFPARFGSRFSGARLDQVTDRGRGQSTAALHFSSFLGEGRGSVLCSLNGGAGMLFAIAAQASRFEGLKSDLVGILQSFLINGPAAGSSGKSAAPGVEYVVWSDPVEHAYSLEAPKGWKVEGGTLRRGAVDVHFWNRFTSPDGQTTIFSSDPDLTSFVIPTQTLAMGGFREGSAYSPGYGTAMTVMHYMSGEQFADFWGRKISGGAMQFKDRRARDDLNKFAAEQDRKNSTAVAQTKTQYGEASFVWGDRAGYVLAGTQITNIASAGAGMWFVTYLAGFVCPGDKPGATLEITAHIIASGQQNPQWTQAQQKTTMDTSRIVTETNDYVSRIRSEAYWTRQNIQDRVARNRDDQIRGVQRVVDPETGREYEAVAGSNYYYRVHTTDGIIGTNATDVPNIDVTLLVPVK